jgi:dCMP deaminase
MCMCVTKAHKYFEVARVTADLFSKDPHKKVCTILLTEDFSRILSVGINGFPKKVKDDLPSRWERPEKYKWVIHSEINAIANAARSGTPIDGCVAVVTMFPCKDCSKALIQAGVKKVYSIKPDYDHERWGEEFKVSQSMFKEVGIDVLELDVDH